jgi:predicted nucleic acid-binding protein
MSLTPTSRIVVDSWAWLELFRGSDSGRVVEKEISTAGDVFTTAVSLAEVISAISRRNKPVSEAELVIRSNSKIQVPSGEDAVETGLLHAQIKGKVPNFSLADAFALQCARSNGAKVLTGDPDFRGLKEAEFLE